MTTKTNMNYKEKAEAYVREKLHSQHLGISKPIQLQHWFRTLELLKKQMEIAFGTNSIAVRLKETFATFEEEMSYGWVTFNLTTGQPATEADYQALCNIFGLLV